MVFLLSFFKNLRFKKKLFLSHLIVSVIPIIILGSFSYYQANNFLQKQAEENLNVSIRQEAGNINFRVTQYDSVVNSIINNFKFQQIFSNNYKDYTSLYRDYVDPFFNNILGFYKDILQVSVYSDYPDIQRGDFVIPLKYMEIFPWYKDVANSREIMWIGKNGRLFCTCQFSGDNTSEADKKDESQSILLLSIDTDSWFKGINNLQLASYGVIITDANGRILLSKNKNINEKINVNKVLSLKTDYEDITIDGMKYLAVKTNISESQWIMYFYTPLNEISADVRSIAVVTFIIIGVCLLALIFIILLFSNTFVKRLNNLNKKMEIVEKGNLKIDVTSQSKDEIGELTNRFGRMLNNINLLINEVYHSKIIQKEAEMKALQTQINPHFLYNTLSIINWKALQIDAMEISHITNTVSKFYRTVLNKGNNIISIRDEVENANAYMEIQLIMHNNKFDFECNIDDAIFQYDMINLVLQPILENALEHGIDNKRKGEGRGKLTLCGYAEGENITLFIEDNGPGMPAEVVDSILTKNSNGYGLKNVNERLMLFFGEQYGLKIHSTLGSGTVVCVTIPRYRNGTGKDLV